MSEERSIAEHVDWILGLEQKFPVEQWTIDDVHIWPLLRVWLTFHFFISRPTAEKGNNVVVTKRESKIGMLFTNSWSLFKFLITSPGKVPVIGADFAAHRAMFDGKLTDKYFDPVFDSFEGRHRGLIVEYQKTEGIDPGSYYKPQRILRFHEFSQLLRYVGLAKAKLTSGKYQLEGYDQFLAALKKEGVDIINYSKENVRKTMTVIGAYKWFWKRLYKKASAKVVVGLCYYTEPLYAMILAARETGVTSVDLQHGGQGKQHLPYAQYTKLPPEGFYDLLPHYFWCWDDSSASVIQQWIDERHSLHKVIQKGHPWLEFIKTRKYPQLDNVKDLVLITLQSYDNSEPEDPVDYYIAEAIKMTAHEVKWYIRLHPRMLPLRGNLKRQMDKLGISGLVDIDNANDLPMPAILGRASVHLTKSSGSAIEAAMLGIPNIILDEHGAFRYEGYIKQGQATLYIEKDPVRLANLVLSIVANRETAPPVLPTNWDFILDLR